MTCWDHYIPEKQQHTKDLYAVVGTGYWAALSTPVNQLRVDFTL